MTVRIYRHDDASAPVVSGTAGALIALLDACLVSGYGAKPAAGWTKAFSGTNLAAYRQGAGGLFFLRVDDTNALYARTVGYEEMSGVSAGAGAFPQEFQLPGGGYIHKSSTANSTPRPWVVMADATKVFVWIAAIVSGDIASVGTATVQFFDFGDVASHKAGDAFGVSFIGGTSTATGAGATGALVNSVASVLGGHFLARSYTQVGAGVTMGKHADTAKIGGTLGMGASNAASATPYPDPVTGGVLLSPIYLHESASRATRGVLRGVWCVLHNMPGACGDTFSGTGDLAGRTFMLLNTSDGNYPGRLAIETSDTW